MDVTSREWVRERLRAIKDTLNREGGVSAAQLRALRALLLIERIEARDEPRRRRWPMVALFVMTLTAVSLVFFARLRSSEVSVDVETSEVSFTTLHAQQFNVASPLKEVGLVGIRIDPAADTAKWTNAAAAACRSVAQTQRVAVRVLGPADGTSSVDVNSLELPSGTAVRVQHAGARHRHQVTLVPSGGATLKEVTIAARGYWRVDAGSCHEQATDLRALTVAPTGSRFDVTMEPYPDALPGAIDLEVQNLAFRRDDRDFERTGSARYFSAIVRGTIRFYSVSGKEVDLREGDPVTFIGSRGTVRVLTAERDRLLVRFSGSIADVRATADPAARAARSLMPTWFEWMTANHGAASLWAAVIYMAGVVIAIARWWGVRV